MIDQDAEKQIVSLSETIYSKFYGKYRGIVTKVGTGREDLGVITVKVPDVLHGFEIPLTQPAFHFAGKDWGFAAFPKKNDGVWIEFEGGNPSKPIWTGGYWLTKEETPSSVDWDAICLVSRIGHKIIMDDKNKKLSIVHSNGPEINLTTDSIIFKVGDTKMVISKNGLNINGKLFEVKT
jgi:hypothetical protein